MVACFGFSGNFSHAVRDMFQSPMSQHRNMLQLNVRRPSSHVVSLIVKSFQFQYHKIVAMLGKKIVFTTDTNTMHYSLIAAMQ